MGFPLRYPFPCLFYRCDALHARDSDICLLTTKSWQYLEEILGDERQPLSVVTHGPQVGILV